MGKNKEFSVLLREIREERKFSQTDLASITGLQPSAISHFEIGTRKPSFDNLRKLADALHVTIDYLLDRRLKINENEDIVEIICRHSENLSEEDKKFAVTLMEALAKRKQ